MAKYYGAIGFASMVEDAPGVNRETIVERKYTGDVLRYNLDYQSSEYLNDNININNQISIVADSFLLDNSHMIRYVEFLKKKWKIRDISISYPRLILTIGGVYNDQYTES